MRGALVLQEDDEETKGHTIFEDGLVSQTSYKLAIIGNTESTSHVIRDNTICAI